MRHPCLALAAALLLAAPAHAAAPSLDAAREVIVLHGQEDGGLPMGESPYAAVEAVLNHLGLVVAYHDVTTGLPDPALAARARGVVSLVTGAASPDPAALAAWLVARQAEGRPVALLGGAGFLQEAADGTAVPRAAWAPVYAGLGLAPEGPASGPAGDGGLRWLPGGWPKFEAPIAPIGPYLASVRRTDPAMEAPLRVAVAGAEGDVVVVGDRGAFVADRALLLEANPITFRLRWRLDPFKLLGRALRVAGRPALDPTTVNGRRAFFAHVDGDGFANLSIEPKPRLSAEVLRDGLLARTWLPTTVSVIAGELAGKKDREALARSIFGLPTVEPAVHSWSHPHDWERNLATPPNVTGDVGADPGGKVVRFDPRKEVDQAVAYVQRLLPPGKRTAIMLWSGRTNPTAPFLARAEAIGVPNLNGGDAMLQPGAPSVAAVSPFARRVGPHLQVYAASANENLYTNLWNGPFDGHRKMLDYYKFTSAPRRLAAVNIYYHFYAAERLAGLAALRDLYAWCERMPLAHLTASAYARSVEGFARARLEPDGPGAWRVADAGTCRSLRLDGEARRVDLDASTGVAGYLVAGDRTWVHLAGPDARVVLADAPADRPRLQEASAQLSGWTRDAASLKGTFDCAAPARVVLAGLPAGRPVRYGGDFAGPATAGPDGKLTLTAGRGRRLLEVRW